MNRSLSILEGAFLSVLLVAGCNRGAASNAGADPNAGQDAQAKTDAANGSKKGGLGSLFETKREVTIPEGKEFEVTLDETLASNRNQAGDNFAASLARPVVEDGKTIIPAGARVTGRVVDAKDAGPCMFRHGSVWRLLPWKSMASRMTSRPTLSAKRGRVTTSATPASSVAAQWAARSSADSLAAAREH